MCLRVLTFNLLAIVKTRGASSVEVFFVDAEFVGDEFDGPRWEKLSRGCDAEGGDLLSVCEHPSAE